MATTKPKQSAYGTWESPIAKDLLAGATKTIADCLAYSSSGKTVYYYLEGRPTEGGRQVIVRDIDGDKEDILPKEFSAASRVHEYGGSAMSIVNDGRIIFIDRDSQAIHYLDPQTKETTLIYKNDGSRFADFDQTAAEGKTLVVAVHEKPEEHYNELVLLDPSSQSIVTTINGADFYTTPRFSPNGKWLIWLQWNLEDMPWTGAQLYVANLDNGQLINHRKLAGQATKESISQPRWGPDGTLYFASDISGYYKLYKLKEIDSAIEPVGLDGLQEYDHMEFSSPEWFLGSRRFVLLTSNLLLATYLYQAGSGLALLDLDKGIWTELPSAYVEINSITSVSDTKFLLCGSTSSSPKELVELDINDSSYRKVITKSSSLSLDPDIFSRGRSIEFQHSNGVKSYAWLWPPHNPDYIAPASTYPPLIVDCHGGPTSHTGPGLDLMKQYWTSRGYAYASVNYRGSSGYGRAYRKELNGKWGDLDPSDAAGFARYVSSDDCPEEIRTSANQVGIVGGSSGGYTVLRALTMNDFPWKAGVSLYGIGNITLLEAGTHKFESRYTRILLDPPGHDLTDEERSKLYHDKSPQFFADHITAATLLLQGREDQVVPLDQAEAMKKEIEKAGQTAKLVVYDGEGHGFRKAESILDMLDQMEQWWRKYLVEA